MKIFLESIKRSFKEVVGRWWFLLAFLSREIVGIITSCVGIFLMYATGSDAYSGINYGWAMDILKGTTPRMVEQSVITAIPWALHRSLMFFVLYLLAYYFLGVVSTKSRSSSGMRKILRNTGIIFFLVNVVVSIIAAVIAYITHNVFSFYLSSLFNLAFPFSFLTYVLIGALMNAKKENFDGKNIIRLISFVYLLFLVERVADYFIVRVFPSGSAGNTVVVRELMFMVDPIILVRSILSFVLFLFSLFVYACIADNEKFFHSLSKGIAFTFKHLQYALVLGFVVYIFTDLVINYIGINLLHIGWLGKYSLYIERSSTILNQYLRIVAITISYNFYKSKKLAV